MEKQQLELQKNLEEINKSRQQEEKQNWITKGLAEISEIFRQDNGEQVYTKLLTKIIKYVEANQGGLYLVNEDDNEDKYLELVSCYA